MEEKKVRMIERRGFKSAVLVVLVVIVVAAVLLLQGKDSIFGPVEPTRLHTGSPAPNITLPGLDGRTVSLKDYRGKVVFLNVWATWCPTCREEMPSMERLYQELKGEAFEILAVSVDKSGARAVASFMKARNLSFPALLDPEGQIARPYGVTGVPESFIINKSGIIEKIVIGPIDWTEPAVVRFIRTLIQKP
jgi:cytochrome c biogenesis protein CcmG/thiol:disulfide interchange protein DsbE